VNYEKHLVSVKGKFLMLKHRKPFFFLFTSLFFSGFLLVLNVLPAQAAAVAPTSTKVTTTMTIVGFNKAVAQQNGYVIVTLPGGILASVPKSMASEPLALIAQQVNPDGTIHGPCGTSSMAMKRLTGTHYQITTGFTVRIPAVIYHWEYTVKGPAYNKAFTHGGGLARRKSWSVTETRLTNGRHGTFTARVVPAKSSVILENGGTCVAGAPSAAVKF
jgi:hypothetical protein